MRRAAKKARHGVCDEVVREFPHASACIQRPGETGIAQAVQNGAHFGRAKLRFLRKIFLRSRLLRALLGDHLLQQLRAAIAKAGLLHCLLDVSPDQSSSVKGGRNRRAGSEDVAGYVQGDGTNKAGGVIQHCRARQQR